MTKDALSRYQDNLQGQLLTPAAEQGMLDQSTEPEEFGYGHIFAILLRRRYSVIGIFAFVLIAAALWTLRLAPEYESSMLVLIEPNYQAKNVGDDDAANANFADANVEVDSTTQLQILRSSEILNQALESLRPEYPTLTLRTIQEGLDVKRFFDLDGKGDSVEYTNIIEITYIGESPEQTQRVLQSLLSVYQLYNLEQQKLRLARGLAFINEQLPAARTSIADAEADLQTFRSRQGVINPNERADAASVSLESIKSERETLKAQYSETLASYQALQKQLSLPPQQAILAARLSESSRYQSLLNQIQTTDLELSRLRQELTDDHPTVQNLQKQRQDQLTLLQQESKRVLGKDAPQVQDPTVLLNQGQLGSNDLDFAAELAGLQKNLASLKARDRSLAQTEAKLQAELKKYPKLIAEYNQLQPEVATRRQTLDKLLVARQELGLEIARGGFDWKVVEAPGYGYKIGPQIKRNLLLGAVVGLFMGVAAAFLQEALDDRVHTSEDLDSQVPLPLLGIIPELSEAQSEDSIVPMPFPDGYVEQVGAAPELFQWQPLRESLDLIYTNIQLQQAQTPYQSLMITSALPGEGKSTLSMGLAFKCCPFRPASAID